MKKFTGSATLLRSQLWRDLGRDVRFQPRFPILCRLEVSLDFLTIIEVIGQRRVDVGESDSGEHPDNFIGAVPTLFVPGDNIGHTNAMSRDASAAAADARSFFNVFVQQGFHNAILPDEDCFAPVRQLVTVAFNNGTDEGERSWLVRERVFDVEPRGTQEARDALLEIIFRIHPSADVNRRMLPDPKFDNVRWGYTAADAEAR